MFAVHPRISQVMLPIRVIRERLLVINFGHVSVRVHCIPANITGRLETSSAHLKQEMCSISEVQLMCVELTR